MTTEAGKLQHFTLNSHLPKAKKMKTKLEDLQQFRHKAGVYQLIGSPNGFDEIVYIGQSKDIYTRILEHCYENKKKFKSVKAIEIKDDDSRLLVETLLIRSYLNPLGYNIEVLGKGEELDLDLSIAMYSNEIHRQLKIVLEPKTEFSNKRLDINFMHFFTYVFYRTENNSIHLEKDYCEDALIDYVSNLLRTRNEYRQLHG